MMPCEFSRNWDPSIAIWGPFLSILAQGRVFTRAEAKGTLLLLGILPQTIAPFHQHVSVYIGPQNPDSLHLIL